MCTEHEHKLEQRLADIEKKLETRTPQDATAPISATLAWPLDYKERKHVYIWLNASATLSFGDYGSGNVQAQVWTNIGMRPGTPVLAPNAGATPIILQIRCTDEIIP